MPGIEAKPARYIGWAVRVLTVALVGYFLVVPAHAFLISFFVGPIISVAFVWRYLAGSGRYPSALWCYAFIPYFLYFAMNQFAPFVIHPFLNTIVLVGFALLVLAAPTNHSGILRPSDAVRS